MNGLHHLYTSIFNGVWLVEQGFAEAQLAAFWQMLQNPQANFETARPRSAFPFEEMQAKNQTVAVFTLDGAITKYDQFCGNAGTNSLAKQLLDIEQNPKYKGVALVIDSGGGEVNGTKQLVGTIDKFRKPIKAYVDGMACSAAQWIAGATDETWASTEIDVFGSIGVMLSFADMKPMYEKMGVKFHDIYSNLSKDKNADFQEAMRKNYEPIQASMLDPIAEHFAASMQKFRPQIDKSTLTGKTYMAKEAVKLGLVDRIGSFQDFMNNFF